MDMLSNKLDEIKKELQELIDIIDGFKSYDEIPSIDIDLMKQKILNSYNDIIGLNKLEIIEQKEDTIIEKDTSEPEIELELIEKVEDAPQESKEFYEKIVEKIDTEEITETVVEEKIEKTEPPTKKTIKIDKSIESPLINIFENIKNDSDNATITQFTQISDVKSAISINERIGIISDIFSGDNNKFNNCLDKINNTEDINKVISELNNITDWDIENHNHKMFLEIIYRKFINLEI